MTNGSPVNGSLTENITIGSDPYQITSVYQASYNGSSEALSFAPTITYTGTVPSTSSDSITINYFQDIYDPSPGPFSASTQTEHVPLIVPTNGTASGQLFFNGTALPIVGPFGPGSYDVSNSQSFGPVSGDYLAYEYQFVFDFAAGLAPGSSAGSPTPTTTPEPAQAIPAALTLVGLAVGVCRRR